MAGLDDWLAVARADDPDEVRERILTGYRAGKPFTPYFPTLSLPQTPLASVLDFGCGLGRNFPFLTSIASDVVGFDLPPMIDRCRELAEPPAKTVTLTSDWGQAAARRYDLVVATLVLQHIEPEACRGYVEDFAAIAPWTYILTRTDSDFGTNVMDLIGRTDRFDAGVCVHVEHDADTNQLRVLGERPFDDLRGVPDGGHYEVLLRSRRAGRP